MEQTRDELSAEELGLLEAQRTWVRDHYEPEARVRFETVEGKLQLLDGILRRGWVEPTETLKLQALGVAFGDALTQRLGLRWIAVTDDYGRDPALVLDGTSILLFPRTTISKRIERGEQVDVHALFSSACATVARVAADEATRA